MLCEQIVIEPLFLRFLQLYLHRRYRSIQKAPGFRRAQMGFMHKTGSAEGVKGATADIRLFSLPPCRLRRGETLCKAAHFYAKTSLCWDRQHNRQPENAVFGADFQVAAVLLRQRPNGACAEAVVFLVLLARLRQPVHKADFARIVVLAVNQQQITRRADGQGDDAFLLLCHGLCRLNRVVKDVAEQGVNVAVLHEADAPSARHVIVMPKFVHASILPLSATSSAAFCVCGAAS